MSSSSASSSTALRGGGGDGKQAAEGQTSRFSFESDDFENSRAEAAAESRSQDKVVSQSSGTAGWDDREAAAPAPPDIGRGRSVGGGGSSSSSGGDVGMKW